MELDSQNASRPTNTKSKVYKGAKRSRNPFQSAPLFLWGRVMHMRQSQHRPNWVFEGPTTSAFPHVLK